MSRRLVRLFISTSLLIFLSHYFSWYSTELSCWKKIPARCNTNSGVRDLCCTKFLKKYIWNTWLIIEDFSFDTFIAKHKSEKAVKKFTLVTRLLRMETSINKVIGSLLRVVSVFGRIQYNSRSLLVASRQSLRLLSTSSIRLFHFKPCI